MITLLVAVGAGAAAGIVFAGDITGEIPVAVSPALAIREASWYGAGVLPSVVPITIHDIGVSAPDRELAQVNDNGTEFGAAAEINSGDQIALKLYIENHSDQAMPGKLELAAPSGLTLEVYAPAVSVIKQVTRLKADSWMFTIPGNTTGIGANFVTVVIAANDTLTSFSTISGKLTPFTGHAGFSGSSLDLDLNIDGGDVAVTTFSASNIVPGDSSYGRSELSNVGTLDGVLDVAFSAITNTGGTSGEYGDGSGDLGGVAEIAVYLDVDQSGDWTAGDIGLKSDGTTYSHPTALNYDTINSYDRESWDDVEPLLVAAADDFVALWRVPTSGSNDIQGDCVSFDVTFTLRQSP